VANSYWSEETHVNAADINNCKTEEEEVRRKVKKELGELYRNDKNNNNSDPTYYSLDNIDH